MYNQNQRSCKPSTAYTTYNANVRPKIDSSHEASTTYWNRGVNVPHNDEVARKRDSKVREHLHSNQGLVVAGHTAGRTGSYASSVGKREEISRLNRHARGQFVGKSQVGALNHACEYAGATNPESMPQNRCTSTQIVSRQLHNLNQRDRSEAVRVAASSGYERKSRVLRVHDDAQARRHMPY